MCENAGGRRTVMPSTLDGITFGADRSMLRFSEEQSMSARHEVVANPFADLDIARLRRHTGAKWSVYPDDVLPLWVVPLVTCSLAIFSGALFWRIRRDRVLLAEGRLVQGRVVDTKKVKHQHHHAHRVRYTFRTLSGATVTGRAEMRRAPGAVGDVISVLYHRDNPRRNAIYPLTLVTRK